MDDPKDLYGLPLDRFVSERAKLAKALRSSGKRDEAARVAKLAKPSAAAWAVNQLVRTQRGSVTRLLAAGDALKQAQRDIVEGRRAGAALREATAVKREALDALMGAARGLLDDRGHGPSEATLARISATLDAAALEDRAREQVQEGCLTRELEHIGLGEDLMAGLSAQKPHQTASERSRERAAQAQARREAAQRAARELEQAQAARDRAAREVQDAQERLHHATEALTEADRALAQARERAAESRAGQRDSGGP